MMDSEDSPDRPAPTPRGEERASESLMRRMRGKGRTIEVVGEGTDELQYLDAIGANANAGGPWLTHILLREEPRLIEAWEEFLHGTQMRCGIIRRLGISRSEAHVKEFMIRHRRLMGITDGDAGVLRILLGEV